MSALAVCAPAHVSKANVCSIRTLRICIRVRVAPVGYGCRVTTLVPRTSAPLNYRTAECMVSAEHSPPVHFLHNTRLYGPSQHCLAPEVVQSRAAWQLGLQLQMLLMRLTWSQLSNASF